MTQASAEERSRQAALAEGGQPVSAGARVEHVRRAVEAGRGIYVNLSGVPEEKRRAVVAEIEELVNRASVPAAWPGVAHPPDNAATPK